MHNAFKAIVKILLLWLVLLALPLQGLAATAAPHCAPPASAIDDLHKAHAVQQTLPDTHHHLPAHDDSQHDGCATACCPGALLPTSLDLPALPAASQPIATRPRYMAGIVHAPPQHPPQALPA